MRAERAAIREQYETSKADQRLRGTAKIPKGALPKQPLITAPPKKKIRTVDRLKLAISKMKVNQQWVFPYASPNRKVCLKSILNLCLEVKKGKLCDRMYTAVMLENGILVRRIR